MTNGRNVLYIMFVIALGGILGSLWGLLCDYKQWGLIVEAIGAAGVAIAIVAVLLTPRWWKEYLLRYEASVQTNKTGVRRKV